jgi:hypothetical protein
VRQLKDIKNYIKSALRRKIRVIFALSGLKDQIIFIKYIVVDDQIKIFEMVALAGWSNVAGRSFYYILIGPPAHLPSSEQLVVFWCGGSPCPSLPRLLTHLLLSSLLHLLLLFLSSHLNHTLLAAAVRHTNPVKKNNSKIAVTHTVNKG